VKFGLTTFVFPAVDINSEENTEAMTRICHLGLTKAGSKAWSEMEQHAVMDCRNCIAKADVY